MSKILRALLISAVATGLAAVALKMLEPETARTAGLAAKSNPYVDADGMTEEERDLLVQELAEQL